MKFFKTPLNDAYLIETDELRDLRGSFARVYCMEEFGLHKLNTTWKQVNHSSNTLPLTLRGLHFQLPPHSEIKLVSCTRGSIWDVIVDLREFSSSFGQAYGELLSPENGRMMYVPKGFAHGFITKEPNTDVRYLVSEQFHRDSERVLKWNDPEVGVRWPAEPLVLSKKDSGGIPLRSLPLSGLQW